jgi:hypothetical protein
MFYLLYHLPCKKSTIFSAPFKKRGGKMKKIFRRHFSISAVIFAVAAF